MQTKQINFAKYSSIKIGSIIEVEIIDDIKQIEKSKVIIGGANNLLISDTPPPLCMLSKEFDYIKIVDDRLVIGGAVKSSKIFNYCKRNDIAGFEFLGKLPGKLGGLVKMNAGLKSYEIFNDLISIKTYNGNIFKENIDYGYRKCNIDDMIYEASFQLQYGFDMSIAKQCDDMRANQPNMKEFPSAGSAFKNPKDDYAGRLIEAVGLKGFQKGGAMFSTIHANFLVNMGNASFDDAIFLINEAKKRVKDEFKIELQEEIRIIDNYN